MWGKVKSKSDPRFIREFERGVLRTTFVSLFAAVIASKKETEGFTLSKLAGALGINKSAVSRWFNGEPNWEVNTIADIAEALNVDVRVLAVDRSTGRRFAPFGEVKSLVQSETPKIAIQIDGYSSAPPTTTKSYARHYSVAA